MEFLVDIWDMSEMVGEMKKLLQEYMDWRVSLQILCLPTAPECDYFISR